MCDICRCSICPSGCPNADGPISIGVCSHCNEDIVIGEEYYEYEGERYHEECFEDIAVELLVEAGATKSEASEYDIDDGSDEAYESYRDERLFD